MPLNSLGVRGASVELHDKGNLRECRTHRHDTSVNAFHVVGECKYSKMPTFWNFMTIIWNHHGKCMQISTNMPGNVVVTTALLLSRLIEVNSSSYI